MDIYSLSQLNYNQTTQLFNIYYPQFFYTRKETLNKYIVQRGEEMRIDLVMLSMYNEDTLVLPDIDVILFINGIDNPLNIFVGDVLYYPPQEALDGYRYVFNESSKTGQNIRNALSVPNKTTKIDSNRKKFTDDGFVLPPVVLDESKPPVRLENGNIVIGGLN
jgi:hypothetical protein